MNLGKLPRTFCINFFKLRIVSKSRALVKEAAKKGIFCGQATKRGGRVLGAATMQKRKNISKSF